MEEDEEVPVFESVQEEAEYWKEKYLTKVDDLLDAELSYEELKFTMKEREAEMEEELQTVERKLQAKLKQSQQLEQQHKDALIKARENHQEAGSHTSRLQSSLDKALADLQQQQKRLRQLEQENDDLERRERMAEATIDNLNQQLEKTTEDSVLVHCELEELASNSEEVIQRLKDEVRDQKHELSVRMHELEALKREGSMQLSGIPSFSTPTISAHDMVSEMLKMTQDLEKQLKRRNRRAKEEARATTPRGPSSLRHAALAANVSSLIQSR